MRGAWAAVGLLWAAPVAAQETGSIAGRVRDRDSRSPIEGAVVTLDRRASVTTDSTGEFRFRAVRSGWHRIEVRALGATPMARESVRVSAGETTVLEFLLAVAQAVQPIDVVTKPDVVLDPLAIATTQRVTAEDLRTLPVTTVEEAVQLQAGTVGDSYRGGRAGQQSFILDGLGVKNQLDASTGGLGIRIPPDVLTEASLVTNGFSARYGQALSGLINVVTKEGGDRWNGRLAYESDRPLPDSWDMGLDRVVLQADGPWLGARLVGAIDAAGRLDADPVNAPPPPDSRDPRSARPNLLPHNSGEQLDVTAKLTLPIGSRQTLRLMGVRSVEQRLLFDPAFKYDLTHAPARRVEGELLTGHWQYAAGARTATTIVADLRVARFSREFMRGVLAEEPEPRFGAFSFERYRFVGEDIATAQDTAVASTPIPGIEPPDFSVNTPWGVPAFFLGDGSRGELAWNRYRESRVQLDLNLGAGRDADLFVGGELVSQRVRTFQRALAYLPVQSGVPPATAADFSPRQAAAYGELQVRHQDVALTAGGRYDRFDSRAQLGGLGRPRSAFSPRLGVSAVLRGATVVVSWGRFHQPPDFQYLVDAAFDDTLRTGRFRVGNPSLGFESASQYEFSVRARPSPTTSLRVNAYNKHLQGLVASVPFGLDPDSTVFGNADFGTVQGLELLYERELADGWGARVSYTLQKAEATAGNAFQLFQRVRIAPTGTDTVIPTRVEFPLDYDRRHGLIAILQGRVSDSALAGAGLAGLVRGIEAAAVFRYSSGLPYSRTNVRGDTLLGLPNSWRLPSRHSLDALLRRPVRLMGLRGSVYVDVRNLLNRRNVVAVRRDSGEPGPGEAAIDSLATAAYNAHPEPIPYESPRYRQWADLNGDGYLAGPDELLPLYRAAARDFFQPLFAFGPPRLVRLGVEVIF